MSKGTLVQSAEEAARTLMADYAETWRLLLQYDEDWLEGPTEAAQSKSSLEHEVVVASIARFRRFLAARGQSSSLFGNRRGEALEGILGSIEQTMFGQPLYRSREEKAAHLLYFLIKDHPFVDGNKRIGSLLFLLYMQQEEMTHRLNAQALTTLTLLIAESAPARKNQMIRLVANMLLEPDRRKTG